MPSRRARAFVALGALIVGGGVLVGATPATAVVAQATAHAAKKVDAKKYVVPAKYTRSGQWGHDVVVGFDSPDHGIQCFTYPGEDSGVYGCTVQTHSWKWPAKAYKACETKKYVGIVAYTSENAPMNAACANLKIIPRERTPKSTAKSGSQVNKVLPLGSTLTFNGTTCESYKYDGRPLIRCTDPVSQGGFQLTSKTYTLFGSLFGA